MEKRYNINLFRYLIRYSKYCNQNDKKTNRTHPDYTLFLTAVI